MGRIILPQFCQAICRTPKKFRLPRLSSEKVPFLIYMAMSFRTGDRIIGRNSPDTDARDCGLVPFHVVNHGVAVPDCGEEVNGPVGSRMRCGRFY
jgi:hypothetical protein